MWGGGGGGGGGGGHEKLIYRRYRSELGVKGSKGGIKGGDLAKKGGDTPMHTMSLAITGDFNLLIPMSWLLISNKKSTR